MNYKSLLIDKSITIKDTIKALDKGAKKVVIVTEDDKLVGIVTDGDIRRWILKNGDLQENVSEVMNDSPVYLDYIYKDNAKKVMIDKSIECLPLVDDKKRIVDIIFLNDGLNINNFEKIDIPVVIMAGGQGTRLYPYTKILPKPLIPIEDIPIVERIINRFNDYGCKSFYLTVNYKKNMIKAYFNEIDRDYDVFYIEEEKPLGTGGSLHLLKDKLKETFFVSNCDILIDANYSDIIKYHKKNNNKITVITSLKNYTVPYGVINLSENGDISSTKEKPEYNFLVNTGMYVLEPDVLEDIPENEFYHITYLIDKYIEEDKKVGTYPITENCWLDMGEFKEMERMVEKIGFK